MWIYNHKFEKRYAGHHPVHVVDTEMELPFLRYVLPLDNIILDIYTKIAKENKHNHVDMFESISLKTVSRYVEQMRTKDLYSLHILKEKQIQTKDWHSVHIFDSIFGLPYVSCEMEVIDDNETWNETEENMKAMDEYWLDVTNVAPTVSRYIERKTK